MGMYDSVKIGKEAADKFNVPEDVYQTKQFNLALDTFEIREDGKIMLVGEPNLQWWNDNIPNSNAIMCDMSGAIVMYTNGIDYTINVVNGYVTHITETAKTTDDFDLDYIDIDNVNWEYE